MTEIRPFVVNYLKEFYGLSHQQRFQQALLEYITRRLKPAGPVEATVDNALMLTELWIAQNPEVNFYV